MYVAPSRREYLLPSRALTTLATAIDARDAEKKRKTFKETAEIWGGGTIPKSGRKSRERPAKRVSLENPVSAAPSILQAAHPQPPRERDIHIPSRKEKKRALARSFAKLANLSSPNQLQKQASGAMFEHPRRFDLCSGAASNALSQKLSRSLAGLPATT